MASKIVVIGSVNGRFKEVFEKVSNLHKKNSFAVAFIAGDLFNGANEDADDLDDLLQGRVVVPLPTYFSLGKSPLPPKVIEKLEESSGELCENLYFLGKRTTIKTSEGIKAVALGGVLDPELTVASSKDSFTPFYSIGDANSLRGAHAADILLTSEWPDNIRSGSKVEQQPTPDGKKATVSQNCIAELCAALKPRYHFSVSDAFFEREPFFHPPPEQQAEDQGYAITRFISLAAFGNTQRQKWIYAFSIDLSASAPLVIPPGTTASPLAFISKKRPLPQQNEAFSRFSKGDNHHHKDRHRPRKKHKPPPPGPSECFFCLSNPDIPTHLITSIGAEAYLTTAKGPLPTSDTFSPLTFPCHIQIIPLPHAPTLSSIAEPETRENTIQEMTRYRTALNNMIYKQTSTSTESDQLLGSVTWEVSRSSGIHTLWQFLPVPATLITRGLVEAAFKVEAENSEYPAFEATKAQPFSPISGTGDSFNVWIWNPAKGVENKPSSTLEDPEAGESNGAEKGQGEETMLVLPLDGTFRFDAQFGRRVLAKLLGLEKRMNWREVEQSVEQETGDAEAFKAAFKEFDFSLEE